MGLRLDISHLKLVFAGKEKLELLNGDSPEGDIVLLNGNSTEGDMDAGKEG
jgi:hypothetical protein